MQVKGIDKHNVSKITQKKFRSFYVFIEHTHSTFKMVVEKVSEPLELITGWPPVGSNNLNQALPVAVDQTCTSLRRNFSPFFLAALL